MSTTNLAESDEILLRMENICKYFPGTKACDHIDFEVKRGEVHALLGENGAGKSTLMKCLYGIYKSDSGCVTYKNQEVIINSASVAIDLGIGMVHQHFYLVLPFTVAENVVLGLSEDRSPLLKIEEAEIKIRDLGKTYGLVVDPKIPVWQLPVGVQQRVEILKALYRNADLLILDEPTSVLTPGEVTELFKVLKGLTEKGLSIIFITHKLEEVMEISDRITVLRDGHVVDTVNVRDTSKRELTKMMVGRDVLLNIPKPQIELGAIVLEVKNLEAENEKHLKSLKNVSFNVHKSEILGIAGVDGNGQKELAETITGQRTVSEGTISILGEDVTNKSSQDLLEFDLAYIPADRQQTGLILDFPITENLIMKEYSQRPYSKYGFLQFKSIVDHAKQIIKDYDIRTPKENLLVKQLSGGNQQKVILGRELSKNPDLIIACQPTRGLDVGATEYVRKIMLEQRNRGAAILLISTELDEIMMLCDRIAVMYEGEILGILQGKDVDIQKIGEMMAGSKD